MASRARPRHPASRPEALEHHARRGAQAEDPRLRTERRGPGARPPRGHAPVPRAGTAGPEAADRRADGRLRARRDSVRAAVRHRAGPGADRVGSGRGDHGRPAAAAGGGRSRGPEPLQAIALKAMEPDPVARYQSAHEMALDLRRFLENQPGPARPTLYASALETRALGPHLGQLAPSGTACGLDLPPRSGAPAPHPTGAWRFARTTGSSQAARVLLADRARPWCASS